jgi:ribosomal protein S18 acetylase RimI-like enzyme
LPIPEERHFHNEKTTVPEFRKIKKLDIKFGELNDKNVDQLRILNYLTLPVVYSEDFYHRLTSYQRYSKLAYLKDVLVGAISCKFEERDGVPVVYIMTITILKPYRRYGIASQLLEQACKDCGKDKTISRIFLHVQSINLSALEFYKKHGFEVVEELKDYYTDITPGDCFVLARNLQKEEKSEQ